MATLRTEQDWGVKNLGTLGVNLLVGVDFCTEQNGASRGLKFQCVYMHLFRQVIVSSGVRQLFN